MTKKNKKEGWEDGTLPAPHTGRDFKRKERKKKENPREGWGWEDGTPPPHRDFKERSVVLREEV